MRGYVLFVVCMVLPLTAGASVDYGGSSTQTVSASAWRVAQQYSDSHLIRSASEYNAFAAYMASQYGISMLPWTYWTQRTNLDERIEAYKGAGLNTGLAVKVSVLCGAFRDVYGVSCNFYPSMIRTSGSGVLSKSQHRIDQGCKAVDLKVPTELRDEVFRMASNLNLTGLGVYSSKDNINMVHVDTGPRRAWTHGYTSGTFVDLDTSHSKRPLAPPSEVLAYLNVPASATLYDAGGVVQYDSPAQAMQYMLSDYAEAHPEIYYQSVYGSLAVPAVASSPLIPVNYSLPTVEELVDVEDSGDGEDDTMSTGKYRYTYNVPEVHASGEVEMKQESTTVMPHDPSFVIRYW